VNCLTVQRSSGVSLSAKRGSRPPPSDPGRLLRRGGERPDEQTACNHAKERPPVHHSITWSALLGTDGGIVRPSALAVFTLITNSNLMGCSPGRSVSINPAHWSKVMDRSLCIAAVQGLIRLSRILDRVGVPEREIAVCLRQGCTEAVVGLGLDEALQGRLDGDRHRTLLIHSVRTYSLQRFPSMPIAIEHETSAVPFVDRHAGWRGAPN